MWVGKETPPNVLMDLFGVADMTNIPTGEV
jgi:hypothetical protein